MRTMKLIFEAKDFQFNVHRLIMFPELKVYARGIVKEAQEDSIELLDDLDMAELERRLLLNHYKVVTLNDVERSCFA